MLFNLVCGVFHMELTQRGCILLYQCFPNLEDSHPVIVWFSFFCIFLHCLAIPSESEPKRWFRKKSNPTYNFSPKKNGKDSSWPKR